MALRTAVHAHHAPRFVRDDRPTPSRGPQTLAPPQADAKPRAERTKTEFASVFQSLTTEMDRGEAAVHAITRGGPAAAQLSTTDLLALQAQVYRYSEAVDLAAKLVDRASNGVKTLLTGQ